MDIAKVIDERTYFNKLRRWQLQFLMRSIGLSYNPSTPATSLAEILRNSELTEEDAKMLLEEYAQKKMKEIKEADQKERRAELDRMKAKNLAQAAPPPLIAPPVQPLGGQLQAPPPPVIEKPVDKMNIMELTKYAADEGITIPENGKKAEILAAIKEAQDGENTTPSS